jgi:hypothetical protein
MKCYFVRMDAEVRRQVIRYRIQDGRLPRNPTIELGHGQGIGQDCDGCGETIATDQRMTVRICADDWRTIRLHDGCFPIWDAERLKALQPGRESTPVKK